MVKKLLFYKIIILTIIFSIFYFISRGGRLKLRYLFLIRYWKILYSFFSGVVLTLKVKDMNKLNVKLNTKFSPFYRGFAFEGAGLGIAILAFSLEKGKSFEEMTKQLSKKSIYQYYVGLGWFLWFLYGRKKGKYELWLKQIDLRHGIILFDGVGFSSCFKLYKSNPQVINNFKNFNNNQQRVCYQGFGRSLWFISRFDIIYVNKEIEKVDLQFQEDVYSGVGIAVAYSWFDRIEQAFMLLDKVPEEFKGPFCQGMAFGYEARRLQDEALWNKHIKAINKSTRQTILKWLFVLKHTEITVANEKEKDNFYLEWVDLLRENIYIKRFNSKKN
ncbi:DUF1702 family protein [Virgibacillus dokdonensis]|uniref:DUF1702 family protein n=1 Tax=Virgibacillus dokdonensis TaxID=302167 RepID=UPI00098B9C3C|nr:DUF1702 family protein [Virgibacillus dokdonensis]